MIHLSGEGHQLTTWIGIDGELGAEIATQAEQCLGAYRAKPNLVEQDAGIEISNVEGGYGRKQLHELVQNGADAMIAGGGRVAVVLSGRTLYCANQGAPLARRGVEALMASHLSTKRNDQIGRFGLGFKSVLGISDAPELISTSGSIRFDRAAARDRILEIVPDAQRTPVLRLAQAFDPLVEAADDPVLDELMGWATTVVRLPLKPEVEWLDEDLAKFPAEFLLFAKHVRRLELDNRTTGKVRGWTTERLGPTVLLTSAAGTVARWNVFHRTHSPSPEARTDAGEIAGRESVQLTWAVPDAGRAQAGQFWAFFPTNSRTTLSGIINAPFKTTEDRHDILDGPYNRELLGDVLPAMVSENLPVLVDPDDPCSVLEILPARGREARSWADDVLNEPVMRAVASVPSIPDLDGRMRLIKDVKLSPHFLAENGRWADLWCSVSGCPTDWIHFSVDQTAERRAKATRLYEMSGALASSAVLWLQALAKSSKPRGSMVAVQLANQINLKEPDQIAAVRRALIVLRGDGTLAAPIVGRLFVPDPGDESNTPGLVHRDLVGDPDTLDALTELGIKTLDPAGRLLAQIANMMVGKPKGDAVERLWTLARLIPAADAARLLKEGFGSGETPVRTMAARVSLIGKCLLPGPIVPSDGSRDADFTLDIRFHTADRDVLSLLGADTGPVLASPKGEAWFDLWRAYSQSVYLAAAQGQGARVLPASVAARPGQTAARLDLLPHLSDAARAEITREVMRLAQGEWMVYAEARGAPGPVSVINPGVWWVRQHGMVATPFGIVNVSDALAPIPDVPSRVLPVPTELDPDSIRALGMKSTLDDAQWVRLIRSAGNVLGIPDLHLLYGAASRTGCRTPESVVIEQNGRRLDVPPGQVWVTADPAAYALLSDTSEVLLASDDRDTSALIDLWGMQDAKQLLSRTILHAASGDQIAAVDRFPGLRVTAPNLNPDVQMIPCSELAVEVTAGSDGARSLRNPRSASDTDSATFYFLDDMQTEDLLRALNTDLRLALGDIEIQQTLDIGKRQESNLVARSVRSATTVEDKLLALAGEDELRKLVPEETIKMAETLKGRDLSTNEIVKMARSSQGSQIIRKLGPAIEARGLAVPKQLAGGSAASSFAHGLGLPAEFAGSRDNTRPAVESVPGPVRLPELHDYQADCIARVRRLLRSEGHSRGLVALPTGSGKTRVAVESIIDHIREESPDALVVWIAQSDELCEQAVETWSYVWRATGTHETKLTINRLWASNDAVKVETGAQLVVATDDKLLSLSRRGRHEWLKDAAIVVVDEAHTSVSKTYTALFNWLGRGTRERDRPLLGLSATPYRGTNEDQTKQLVNRYDQNLLTDGLFGDRNPHAVLQELGVLARVRHQVLEGMTLTPLRASGREEGDALTFLDSRIDLDKVANDEQRNRRIFDSITSLDAGVTALVFAASVTHAEQLAAVLDIEGVPAAAVSSFTAPGERRERIRQFHSGEIRVLTNYNVLSQGFDAPRVGAVFVTRPTFSPNRYQQMIGRGLRGPLNGGSNEVLIVNVKDNIDAFGDQLAFHHFDELWREQ